MIYESVWVFQSIKAGQMLIFFILKIHNRSIDETDG